MSLLSVAALLNGGIRPTTALSAEAESRKITIAVDSTQEQALAALHRATGQMVLAECTKVNHRAQQSQNVTVQPELLRALTADYHLHAMYNADQILFVRRFWDPRELPDVPFEEIRGIAGDLSRLVTSLAPRLADPDAITQLHKSFLLTLTNEQLADAQQKGLSYTAFNQNQRQIWDTLTADVAFSGISEELRQSASLFHNWERSNTFWKVHHEDNGDVQALWMLFPDIGGVRGLGDWEIYRIGPEQPQLRPVSATPSVEELPAVRSIQVGCRRGFTPTAQPVTLRDLVSGIGEANSISIEVPEYARTRRFFAYTSGHSGDEILQALALVNGWEVRRTEKKRCVLGRPRVSPPRDARDYHRQARALVPPALRLLSMGSGVPLDAQIARREREWGLLLAEVKRLKGSVTGFRTAVLDTEWQRRLANLLFEWKTLHAMVRELTTEQPVGWLAAPETGFLRIEGELGPGKHPRISFYVPHGILNGRMTYDVWGWIANTSSQEQ